MEFSEGIFLGIGCLGITSARQIPNLLFNENFLKIKPEDSKSPGLYL